MQPAEPFWNINYLSSVRHRLEAGGHEMNPLKLVWFIIVPFIYPLISAPLLLPMMLVRPLQLVGVIIVTVLLIFSQSFAIGFSVVFSLWFAWTVLVPPRDFLQRMRWNASTSSTFFGKLGQVAFTAGTLLFFIYFMDALSLATVLKWFASFFLAYYCAGVVMGLLTLPDAIAEDLALKRILNGSD
jgi:hypothetical protein